MHILIVTDGIYPYSMGGSHRLIYEACKVLRAGGHQVTCLIPAIGKNANFSVDGPDAGGSIDFRVIRFPLGGRDLLSKFRSYFWGYRKPVEEVLKAGPVDVINVHYLPALFSLRGLFGRHRIHYTFHGPWAGEFRLSVSGRMDGKRPLARFLSRALLEPSLYFAASRLEGALLRKCDRFMVLSNYMKSILTGVYRVDPNAVSVIPSGINQREFFPQADESFRKELNIGKSVVFLTIRRLEKRMGLDLLIRACAHLKEEFDDFALLIGGKGIQFDYLSGLIRSLGLEDNVRMLGFVPEADMRKFLSLANLFILPSRDLEGFGLVVLESMACGTPVLVSPRGGPPEVVGRFDQDLVLPSLEPKAIAERLKTLIGSGSLGKDKSPRCVEFVKSGYSWEKFSGKYLEWVQ